MVGRNMWIWYIWICVTVFGIAAYLSMHCFHISISNITISDWCPPVLGSKNLFSSCALGYLGCLLSVLTLTDIYDCVLLSTRVDQALCLDGSAGPPVPSQISRCLARTITHLSISQGSDLFWAFLPRAFHRRLLLAKLLPDSQTSPLSVVLSLLSYVWALRWCHSPPNIHFKVGDFVSGTEVF